MTTIDKINLELNFDSNVSETLKNLIAELIEETTTLEGDIETLENSLIEKDNEMEKLEVLIRDLESDLDTFKIIIGGNDIDATMYIESYYMDHYTVYYRNDGTSPLDNEVELNGFILTK